jgi:glycosyltransferase involved in cell wall biosynthesis
MNRDATTADDQQRTPHGGASLAVAQLVETLGLGGAERLAVQIANALAVAGHRSHLLVLGGPGPLSAQIDPAVQVVYLQHERAPIGRPWRFLASIRRGYGLLVDQVARHQLAVVQSHLPGANFWGLVLALRRRCRVVVTVHNNREFDYGDRDHPLRATLRRRAYRLMLRHCTATVAVSAEVASSLLREVGARPGEDRRLVVVPNGVEQPPPLDPAARTAIRERFGVDPATLLLLAAGRHSEQKNFRTLIDAAALLRDRGLDFRLVIAGDGTLRPAHQEQAARLRLGGHVAFPGNLDDLPRVMQAVDGFVLPSLWEGLPLVLLEALAAGAPVVGTRIAGVREVVTDERDGLLVEPGDAQALADAIARLQDPGLRARLRAAGLELVRREYAFDRVVARLVDLYRGGPDAR